MSKKKELKRQAEEQAGKVEKLYQILQLPQNTFSAFISEANDSLKGVADELNRSISDPEQHYRSVTICFRKVHSLKGNARSLNLDSIAQTAHGLESEFAEFRETRALPTPDMKQKALEALAKLQEEVNDGDSLFKKILGMQNNLNTTETDPLTEWIERMKRQTEQEAELAGKVARLSFKNEVKVAPDRNPLLKLQNPISQILRNSVSHGIETPETRQKRNKSETGRVQIRIFEESGRIKIDCIDDGGGLNSEKIREKALALGIISAKDARDLPPVEINNLIFHPGLSTAEAITESAGRGVGMDIVREEVESIGAIIQVHSQKEKHTRFRIILPS